MKCQVYVSARSYGRPGQCESLHGIKEVIIGKKRIKGLCGQHRRVESTKKLQFITDSDIIKLKTLGVYGKQAEISGMSSLQIK